MVGILSGYRWTAEIGSRSEEGRIEGVMAPGLVATGLSDGSEVRFKLAHQGD